MAYWQSWPTGSSRPGRRLQKTDTARGKRAMVAEVMTLHVVAASRACGPIGAHDAVFDERPKRMRNRSGSKRQAGPIQAVSSGESTAR